MKQQRQGVRSTQEKDQEEEPSNSLNKKKTQRRICQHLGQQRKNTHRSNWKVPLPVRRWSPLPDDNC